MKKKLLAAMLCVAMAATSLVGCGGSGEEKKEETDSELSTLQNLLRKVPMRKKWN